MGTPLLAPSRGSLLAGCVSLWALRLGGYLFYRVLQVGCSHIPPMPGLALASIGCVPGGQPQIWHSLSAWVVAPPSGPPQQPQQRHCLPACPPACAWTAGRQGCPAGSVFPAARGDAADGAQQVSGLQRGGAGAEGAPQVACWPLLACAGSGSCSLRAGACARLAARSSVHACASVSFCGAADWVPAALPACLPAPRPPLQLPAAPAVLLDDAGPVGLGLHAARHRGPCPEVRCVALQRHIPCQCQCATLSVPVPSSRLGESRMLSQYPVRIPPCHAHACFPAAAPPPPRTASPSRPPWPPGCCCLAAGCWWRAWRTGRSSASRATQVGAAALTFGRGALVGMPRGAALPLPLRARVPRCLQPLQA